MHAATSYCNSDKEPFSANVWSLSDRSQLLIDTDLLFGAAEPEMPTDHWPNNYGM